MKLIIICVPVILFFSCNQNDPAKYDTGGIADTSISNKQKNLPVGNKTDSPENNHKTNIDTPGNRKVDTALLLKVSAQIVKFIKTRNYNKIASFVHPKDRIRFSPYAYIDTVNNQSLSSFQLVQMAKQNISIDWDTSWDDDEKPELMTIDQYFLRFVYDVDFLNAKLISVNKFHSQGTDPNNIAEIYPDCNAVEFFFPGFEEKYGGMDFRA